MLKLRKKILDFLTNLGGVQKVCGSIKCHKAPYFLIIKFAKRLGSNTTEVQRERTVLLHTSDDHGP